MDAGSLLSLGAAQIGVAGTIITDPVTGFNGLAGLSGWLRFAGTGGTSLDAYLQTSPDGGTTWLDLYNAHFTAAGVALFSLVNGAGANLAVTDGGVASNTALNSGVVPLFDQFRMKFVSVGTWTNGLVSAYAMPRG